LHAQYFNKKGSVRQRVKKIHTRDFFFMYDTCQQRGVSSDITSNRMDTKLNRQ